MAGYSEPKLLAMGDAAWTIELGADIDIDVNARCMGLAAAIAADIEAGTLVGILDIVPTFRSVTVHFDPREPASHSLPAHLQSLARVASAPPTARRTWRLPACFDARYAPDLQAVAERQGISPDTVVAEFCPRHCGSMRWVSCQVLPTWHRFPKRLHARASQRLAPRSRPSHWRLPGAWLRSIRG